MTAKATDVRNYTFHKEDRLLLDANIWLSVYGPIASHDWRTEVYSKVLNRIFSSKCLIFIDSVVLSEYINRFVRLEYDQMDERIKPPTIKKFRSTPQFKEVAAEAAITVKNILSKTTCCNFNFEAVNVVDLLSDYEAGIRDFSDSLIVELCKEQELVLITHDGDFKNCGVPILTAHKRLLN